MKNLINPFVFLLFFISCKQKETGNTQEKDEVKKVDSEILAHSFKEDLLHNKNQDCDLKTLIHINSILEKNTELNDQDFTAFFTNMIPNCANNIEYSQFNNELIFKTLESNPKKFITFLNRISKKKELLEFVITQLQNPINDTIELNKIYLQLEKTNTDHTKTKELVSKSIQKAIQKNK